MATPNPNLIYRTETSSSLTYAELDGNFAYLSQSIADISYVENAATASYVDAANVDGQVLSAANADNATTASYVEGVNVDGYVNYAGNSDQVFLTTSGFGSFPSGDYPLIFGGYNVNDGFTSVYGKNTSLSFNPSNNSLTISGSVLVSGSIIPNTDGISTTSSFDLGSPTAAWKDIYVSNGTINFLDAAGNVVQTIGTGNNQLDGDTFINGRLFQGFNVTASGLYAHAEGTGSKALGIASHAEGRDTIAGGFLSGISAAHAEGRQTTASGRYSHTEGQQTYALGEVSHAEGFGTFTNGTALGSHAEGYYTRTDGGYSHAEGSGSQAWSQFSHAEGINTYTYDPFAPLVTSNEPALGSHAEGEETRTVGRASHAEGYQTFSSGSWSHAEGYQSEAVGLGSHAEGLGTVALADYQHVAGRYNEFSSNPDDLFIIGNGSADNDRRNIVTVDIYSLKVEYGDVRITGSLFINEPSTLNQFVQGHNNILQGFPGAPGAHIQGRNNQIGSNGNYSHVEGWFNAVDGYACHAEGRSVTIGLYATGSHAEGYQTKIARNSNYSHVEGSNTIATGSYSHAEGIGTITIGTGSHAEGLETIAKGNFQHVQGQYNATSSVDSAFIVGNGYDDSTRSNLIFAAEETVEINNLIKLTVRSTNPPSPQEGMIMASGSAGASKLYYYNGASWNALF